MTGPSAVGPGALWGHALDRGARSGSKLVISGRAITFPVIVPESREETVLFNPHGFQKSWPIRREWLDASSLWSPFGIAWALMAKVNATTRRCFFARSIKLNLIFKSVFVLTSRIARSSARCWKFAQTGKGASLRHFLPVLDRLHVRKDFHPRSDPIQGGKLELFVQVFFLFFLYGSDNAKKSVGLVADPGSEIKPIIKKVDSPKSIEI